VEEELLQFLIHHAALVVKKTFAPKITENSFNMNEALSIVWILYIVGKKGKVVPVLN
jgi:hypothetical protein